LEANLNARLPEKISGPPYSQAKSAGSLSPFSAMTRPAAYQSRFIIL
jgi:hypothetical protein